MSVPVLRFIASQIVMAGLDPAIHVLAAKKDVDDRHKAGHDDEKRS
jgi:hypothetical protein